MSKNSATPAQATSVQKHASFKKQSTNKGSSSISKTLQIQEKAKFFISKMEEDLHNIKIDTGVQLVKIVEQNNGTIPLKDQAGSQTCYNFLNADPKRQISNTPQVAQLRSSINDKLSTIKAKIEKVERKYEITPQYFNNFKQQIELFETNIRNLLSHDPGIREIIIDPLKIRLLEKVPLLNTGDSKKFICAEIASYIKIPTNLQMPMLQEGYHVFSPVNKLISREVLKTFAIEIKESPTQIFGYFNVAKFPDKTSRSDVSKKLASTINNILEAKSIIVSATAKLTEGKKLNKKQSENLEKQTEKITSILCPIIAKCNETYLENNKAQIIAQLTKDLKSSAGHNINNKFTISTKKLMNLSKQFTETYNKQSETVTTEKNIPAISEVKDTPNVMSKASSTTMELQDTANGGEQYQAAKQLATLQESTVKQESFNTSKDMLAIASQAEQQEKLANNHDLLLPHKTSTLAAPTVSNKELSAEEINQYYTKLQAIGKNSRAIQKYFDHDLPTLYSKDNQIILINKWLEMEEANRGNIKLIWVMRVTRDKLQNTASLLPDKKFDNMEIGADKIGADHYKSIVEKQDSALPPPEDLELTKVVSPTSPANLLQEVECNTSFLYRVAIDNTIVTLKTQQDHRISNTVQVVKEELSEYSPSIISEAKIEIGESKQAPIKSESWFWAPLGYVSSLVHKVSEFANNLSSLVQQGLEQSSVCKSDLHYSADSLSVTGENTEILGGGIEDWMHYFVV